MAALLTSVRDDKDKSALYLSECRRMGIKVLPPDVNESNAEYTPRGKDIRFGLAAIRNVGEGVVASIKASRTAKGAFTSFGDFLAKVDAQVCNKKTIESLIKGGAFDSLRHPRKGLMSIHLEAIDSVIETKRAEAIGQFDLFGGESMTQVSSGIKQRYLPLNAKCLGYMYLIIRYWESNISCVQIPICPLAHFYLMRARPMVSSP